MPFFIKHILLLLLMAFSVNSFGQVTFVIDQLPKATPPEDSIFICGTFNDWCTNCPQYMLKKRLDGKYFITIPKGKGSIEYKFTRGSWPKSETNKQNDYLPNRKLVYGNGETVFVSIANWQDLGGAKPLDISVFYYFAMALQGGVTAYFLIKIKNKQKKKTSAILYFLYFISISLLGKIIFEVISSKWLFYLPLIGDNLLFITGPLFYFIFNPSALFSKSVKLHFIPVAFMLLLTVLKASSLIILHYLEKSLFGSLFTIDTLLFAGMGLISNIIYFILAFSRFKELKSKDTIQLAELGFYKLLLLLSSLFLAVCFFYLFFITQEKMLFWNNKNLLFFNATLFIALISFYVLKYPDIFKMSATTPLKSDSFESLKVTLHAVMKDKECYKNPDLGLNELSEIIQVKPYLLSRVINESYHQNFRDFVNRYRVEEFIHLANQKSNKRYTFLALAFEVGFRSKSTFNAAFKKVTKRSPREYFKENNIRI